MKIQFYLDAAYRIPNAREAHTLSVRVLKVLGKKLFFIYAKIIKHTTHTHTSDVTVIKKFTHVYEGWSNSLHHMSFTPGMKD